MLVLGLGCLTLDKYCFILESLCFKCYVVQILLDLSSSRDL